ncbi:beta,beta-carotene 15,15'-dioxygenase-like [Acanthaster planci]|uniref:Beta,beta-carotene 15,15'-dioxygenase-like n=1 Tax=Acanthaster planci TaxID=133434 RepID=A0A8B7YD39_ACAPL|nr:beta,beta-carotene 15,15'-dioxygenase-like [Acanthaster planci]
MAGKADDPNIAKLFQSVQREYPDPVEATIKGKLPKWLQGSLIRNGPGLFEVGDTSYQHWFDGLSLLHRFSFEKGKVTYQNRFLRSDAYTKAKKYNKIIYGEFGTMGIPDPCKNILERFVSHFIPVSTTDNNLINLYWIGDELYTASETNTPIRINVKDLSTGPKIDLFGAFWTMTATAHGQVDHDGTTYNVGTSYFTGCNYNIIKFNHKCKEDPTRSAKIVCTIPARYKTRPSYYHSFGMTENYFVFLEQTLFINVPKLATSVLRKIPVCQTLEYDPTDTSLFHVIQKTTGEILPIKFAAGPLFGMHIVNSYEQDGQIVFDICCFPDDSLIKKFYLEYLRYGDQQGKRNFPRAQVRRFVLPINIDQKTTPRGVNLVSLPNTSATAVLQDDGVIFCKYDIISPVGFDMPNINQRVNGRPYRYAYGNCNREIGEFVNTIVKADVKTRKTLVWHEEFCYPSEPVFVEAPNAVKEDDGVILSSVLNSQTGRAFLLVLDAKDFKELARANLPADVECPLSFHGQFIH